MIRKLVILFLVAWFAFQPHTDLDLGWHLKYGEYFFKTGEVLKQNLYSFVWPNYHWVQASWGYDLIIYQIFRHFGFWGLSIAGSLMTAMIFSLLVTPMRRFNFWKLLFLAGLFLSQTTPLYGGGFRSQSASSLLFALAMILAWHSFVQPTKTLGLPTAYFFPLLFLIWANLHGGFALGLMLLWLMWAISGVLKTINRKFWLLCGASLAVSTLTPLVNPWGRQIYAETFKHSSNVNLVAIAEWMPLWTWRFEAMVTAVVTVSILIVALIRKQRTHLPYLLAFFVTTYLAFSALRFTIIFGIMATYYWAQNLPYLNARNKMIQKSFRFLKIAPLLIILFDVFFSKRYFAPMNPFYFPARWEAICEMTHDCSVNVAEAMNADPPAGNGFHPYNWGGFLIWNVPSVKTFLDGRMAAWEEDGRTPPILEGDTVSSSPNPVSFKRFETEYDFRWAIVPTSAPLVRYLEALVKQDSWELRYRDEWHSYYVKKN